MRSLTVLAILLAVAAVPAAFTVWVRLDRAGHFIYGAIAAATTHAGFTILAYTLWTTP